MVCHHGDKFNVFARTLYHHGNMCFAASAIREIKHEVRGRDANKARGEAECFISRIARARQCFNCFIEFPEKRFDINLFAGSYTYTRVIITRELIWLRVSAF